VTGKESGKGKRILGQGQFWKVTEMERKHFQETHKKIYDILRCSLLDLGTEFEP